MSMLKRHSLFVSSENAPFVNRFEDNISLKQDPLCGVGNDVQEATSIKLINSVVFAEPLNYPHPEREVNAKNGGELTFIDNVVVQKTAGKRNKYHMDIEDFQNPRCPQHNCKKTFSSMALLKAHIRKTHCSNKNRYICDRCGSGFPAQYLLRRHAVIHRSERVQCPVCRKSLSARSNLSTHLKSHADTRPHECVSCHKRFVRKCTLDAHIKFVHRVGELNCDKCDATFVSRTEWSRHKSSHDESRDVS